MRKRDFLKLNLTRREALTLGIVAAGYSLFTSVVRVRASEKAGTPATMTTILKYAADALLPPGGSLPQAPSQLGVPEEILQFVSKQPPSVQKDFRSALMALEVMPILELRFKRFTSMSPQERVQYFASWEKSRWGLKRKIFVALKSAVTFAYFSHPEVWEKIGYEGPLI